MTCRSAFINVWLNSNAKKKSLRFHRQSSAVLSLYLWDSLADMTGTSAPRRPYRHPEVGGEGPRHHHGSRARPGDSSPWTARPNISAMTSRAGFPGTGKLRFIEVKGRQSGADTVTVTKNEILTALNKPEDFILGIVEFLDGGDHRVHYLRQPFQKEPDFDVTSVNYKLNELINTGRETGVTGGKSLRLNRLLTARNKNVTF